MRSPVLALLALTAISLLAGPANADERQAAAVAEALFDEGRTLMEAGRIREACVKLARSQELDPGGGTLLNLALCHEREGRTATAHSELGDALAQAIRDQRPDRQAIAREHLARIAPRLSRITVRAAGDETPTVRLDGAILPVEALGTAFAVDPGPHVIEASAPGRISFRSRVDVAIGETADASVPVLAREAAAARVPPPLDEATGRAQRGIGAALGFTGLGIAVIGVGVYFAAKREAEAAECTPHCASKEFRLYQDLQSAAIGGMLVGALTMVTGIVLYIAAPRGRGMSTAPQWTRAEVRF